MIMFEIFPSGVAVDTSKITALYIDDIIANKKTVYIVNASCDGDYHILFECKNEDDAKAYLKKLVDELNAEKGN